MAFMSKDWVTFGAWLKFEVRRFKRAWKELNLVTLICALLGSGTGYCLQYLTGLKQAHDVFPIAAVMLGGAVVGFLFHFTICFITAPAKMLADTEARVRELEAAIDTLNKKQASDQAMRRRRGAAPFLRPVEATWVRLYIGNGPHGYAMLRSDYGGLLCAANEEVKNLPDSELVYFPVENHGKPSPAVSLRLDGKPIELQQEPKISNSKGYYFFTYPYEKAKHGQKQLLTMTFETSDGEHDAHQYVIIHGQRILTRVDPPLPSAS